MKNKIIGIETEIVVEVKIKGIEDVAKSDNSKYLLRK